MRIRTCFILLPVFLLSGCFGNLKEEEHDYSDLPTVQVEHDYSEIKDYELSWEALFDPDDDEYFVYFYSTTCNHCSELKNYIIDKALSMKNIYFIKGSNKVVLVDDVFPTIGKNTLENMGILGFPSCLKIENHVCIKNVAGIPQIKELIK